MSSALIASWLTPTSLFLLLNVMIGTIFFISRLSPPKMPHRQQFGHDGGYNSAPSVLQRAPSLLDRVKSINYFSTYKFPLPNLDFDHHLHHADNLAAHPLDGGYNSAPPVLQRAPSLLDRVKSINYFSTYKFPLPNLDFDHHLHHADNLAAHPLERVKAINFSLHKYSPQNPDTDYIQPTEHDYTNPQPLSRAAPSLLKRVKSIEFTSFYRWDSVKSNQQKEPPPTEEADSDTDMIQVHGQVKRSISEDSKAKQRKLPEKMKISASENSRCKAEEKEKDQEEEVERRRAVTTRIEKRVSLRDDDQGVDAKADDFINKFKQELKLERLDSLLRYRNMLIKGK